MLVVSGQQFLSAHHCRFVEGTDVSVIPERSAHPSLFLHDAAISSEGQADEVRLPLMYPVIFCQETFLFVVT